MKTSKVLGDILEKARKVGETKVGKDGKTRVWSKTPSGFDWRRVKGGKKTSSGKTVGAKEKTSSTLNQLKKKDPKVKKNAKPNANPEVIAADKKEKDKKFYSDKGTPNKKPKTLKGEEYELHGEIVKIISDVSSYQHLEDQGVDLPEPTDNLNNWVVVEIGKTKFGVDINTLGSKYIEKKKENKIYNNNLKSFNDISSEEEYVLKQLEENGYSDKHKGIKQLKRAFTDFKKVSKHVLDNLGEEYDVKFSFNFDYKWLDYDMNVEFNKYQLKEKFPKDFENSSASLASSKLNVFAADKGGELLGEIVSGKFSSSAYGHSADYINHGVVWGDLSPDGYEKGYSIKNTKLEKALEVFNL